MKRIGAIAAVVVMMSAQLAFAAKAKVSVDQWRQQHEREIVREFASLLSLPNVANDADGIERNVAAIRGMLEKRGVEVHVLRLPGAPPLIVGDIGPSKAKAFAFYAHYDGQPADASKWTTAPWSPVLLDPSGTAIDLSADGTLDPESRIRARSAGDDKASIMAMISAIDALRATGKKPSAHVKFVFEGEEEAGSTHLPDYLSANRDLLRADAWLICDGPVHQSRRMELFFGARGVQDLELTVYGPNHGLHDGHYGNWVPNPIVVLTHLIDSMRDENGRILIEHFYDDVVPPSAAEKEALASIPNVEEALRREFGIMATEHGGSLNERIMLPALNLRGISSGKVGEQASNTIQPEARASIDFRLVPAETPETIRALVEKHIAAQGFAIVRDTPDAEMRLAHSKLVKVEWGAGYGPARTALDLPFSRDVARILERAGHSPVLLPTVGGSVPMKMFENPPGTPVIGLPIANHDDNQHAADENLRLQNLWDGIDMFATLFSELR